MQARLSRNRLSPFRIIITGFGAVILIGTLLLMLPISAKARQWTSIENALFTATSAVCVTGLVVQDTATYWSAFGQAVILVMIQIGGLGIVSVAAFIATISGKKVSLLQRSVLQESISAHQVGGLVKMTAFIFEVAFLIELIGAVLMFPVFFKAYGAYGIWMSVFHSVSAFCNAGFDIMGDKTGIFTSLTAFSDQIWIVIPVCLLIVIGGIGFLTWEDIAEKRFHVKKYRLQSKVVLTTTAVLIVIPAMILFFNDFSFFPLKERICLSVFHAITPRTAGFNTIEMSSLTGAGRAMTIALMVIGGSPGSTAGGLKTTTIAVLIANVVAVIRRRKSTQLFGRRIEDSTIKTASTLMIIYLGWILLGAFMISIIDGLPIGVCLFETASAVGTVGLSYGITPSLGLISHLILIGLMFFGRVGGLTLMYAALSYTGNEFSQCPVEKINVG